MSGLPKFLALACIAVLVTVDVLIGMPAAPQARPPPAPASRPPTSLAPPPSEIPTTTAPLSTTPPPSTAGKAPDHGIAPEPPPGLPPTTMTTVSPTAPLPAAACGRPGQFTPSTLRHTWPTLTSRAVDHGKIVCVPG